MRPFPKARIKLGGGVNLKFTKNGTSVTRSGYCPTSLTKSSRGRNNEHTECFEDTLDNDAFFFEERGERDDRSLLKKIFDRTVIFIIYTIYAIAGVIYVFFNLFIFGVLLAIILGLLYIIITFLSLLF
mgnify:FL=1